MTRPIHCEHCGKELGKVNPTGVHAHRRTQKRKKQHSIRCPEQ